MENFNYYLYRKNTSVIEFPSPIHSLRWFSKKSLYQKYFSNILYFVKYILKGFVTITKIPMVKIIFAITNQILYHVSND